MITQYGFLQGTFGLPYGGYCIRPLHLNDILLSPNNPSLSMFCILGKYGEVLKWLCNNNRIVVSLCTTQDTFTHDLAVEVYNKSSTLARIIKGKRAVDVQLVIRIARTWDRGCTLSSSPSCQFKPMVKILAPSGITLAEISSELNRAIPGSMLDVTRNKALLSMALSRVSTRSSYLSGNSQKTLQIDNSQQIEALVQRNAASPLPSDQQQLLEHPPKYSQIKWADS
ncbi:hypothetical protein GGI25_004844 [Coemansia spiralis]|uniref:Uncharacterized protein n=2 Tax=Coemansia TaxID=4863 RepID=A0A9W8G4D0_9FUNG|nr:hypothetical protein BX070DRAFT_229096 [Coemansia spiralis]KAJ1991202.1 hypothetical protein EDC05_003563 [Coemansia umbellata]KAJ2621171.1 hypothetical protein GGI26_004339 [Coemansia sp. RSA 1358]KAJ2673091.1 hypothetical protein GGI25_004844 [Coemansia spiralis]